MPARGRVQGEWAARRRAIDRERRLARQARAKATGRRSSSSGRRWAFTGSSAILPPHGFEAVRGWEMVAAGVAQGRLYLPALQSMKHVSTVVATRTGFVARTSQTSARIVRVVRAEIGRVEIARGLDVLGEICSISNAAMSRATRDDWDDTEWMASLLPLCADVLDGDWRCLYLAWLCGVQGGERREAAARTDNAEEFTERLRPFLDRHTRKTCLIRRLRGPIARSHNG